MQRFGRSAQKMKDRWGGGFILATVLALVGAWYLGGWLSGQMNDGNMPTAGNDPSGIQDPAGLPGAPVARDFSTYFVQAGAFKTSASADKEAARLAGKGFQAAVVRVSAEIPYRVMVGPFTTVRARDEARARLKSVLNIDGLPRTWNIGTGPALPASATGAGARWQEGVAYLNNYLQEAAAWWENRAAGNQVPTDALVARGRDLKTVAESLRKQASDPMIAHFVQLAEQAETNAAATAAAAGGAGGENHRALQGFVALLDSYRDWAAGGTDPTAKN